jgi:hypothetical protein
MARVDIKLSGGKLEYQFAKMAGFDMIGSEDGPFALFHDDHKAIFTFGEATSLKNSSFTTDCANVPLELALAFGASFHVEDGNAVCEINGISCAGSNYMEAAMKTLILQYLEEARN